MHHYYCRDDDDVGIRTPISVMRCKPQPDRPLLRYSETNQYSNNRQRRGLYILTPFDCNHNGECNEFRLCCIDTEMTLTREDAKRIDDLGYQRNDYLIRTSDGFCQLRNIDNHCYFYDSASKLCSIYESRPEGCTHYPIVYDMRKKKCVRDKDCPSRDTMTRGEIRNSCHKVRDLVKRLRREALHHERPC